MTVLLRVHMADLSNIITKQRAEKLVNRHRARTHDIPNTALPTEPADVLPMPKYTLLFPILFLGATL